MFKNNDNTSSPQWKPLTPDASFSVFSIAEEIHTELSERREVFEEKIKLAPSLCRGLYVENKLKGYGIAHPWTLYSIPSLDSFLINLPVNPTCVYIHDVALLPEMRGMKQTEKYVEYVKREAFRMNINALALVSVYGTDIFWSRYGFFTVEDEIVKGKLSSYGDKAQYMVCNVN